MDTFDEKTCRDELLRTLGEHSASIIHELRSPLAAVQAQLQTMEHILRKQGDTSQEARFALLYDEIAHMNTLLNQYLLLAGNRPPVEEQLLLPELARDVCVLLKSALLQHRITYSVSLKNDKVEPIYSDGRQIKQILVNLITNAMEAMPDGGTLTVLVEASATEQRIFVQDTGCGMDAAVLQQIFNSFFSTKSRGSGLGLAISRQLAEGLGGNLLVTSTPGQGSRFVLSLPCKKAN